MEGSISLRLKYCPDEASRYEDPRIKSWGGSAIEYRQRKPDPNEDIKTIGCSCLCFLQLKKDSPVIHLHLQGNQLVPEYVDVDSEKRKNPCYECSLIFSRSGLDKSSINEIKELFAPIEKEA